MRVTLNYCENMHFSANARDFKNIHVDEAETFHGNNLAPSPIEYFLIGTGGCIGSTFAYCLQKNKIPIVNLEIVVDGTLKHSGPKSRLRLINIKVELIITLKKDESNENFNFCRKTFLDHCPISNLLIPLNIKVTKKLEYID